MMNNKVVENPILSTPVVYEAGGKEVKLTGSMVKKFLVKGNKNSVTDQELTMFINLCKYQELNPFLNEAYIVKYGKDAQIIVGKEAFMKRAYRSPDFQRLDAGIIVLRDKEIVYQDGSFKLPTDVLVGGWATLHRKEQEPFQMTVSFEEFDTGKSTWKEKPALMIRKVAQVNCLREAYPEQLGALYTEDEMNLGTAEIVEEVEEKETEANSQEFTFDEVEQEEEIPFAYSEEVEEEIEVEESPQVEPEIDGQTSIEDLSIDELPTSL